MNENEQPTGIQPSLEEPDGQPVKIQSPLHRAYVMASIASFAALILFYWTARRAVSQIEGWWLEFLVYASIPVAVNFVILYRSCWHREIQGAARTCSLLVLSSVIFVTELIAIGTMLCLAAICFCVILFGVGAMTGGNH